MDVNNNKSHQKLLSIPSQKVAVGSSNQKTGNKPKPVIASSINLKAAMEALSAKGSQSGRDNAGNRDTRQDNTGPSSHQTLTNFYQTGSFPHKLQVNRFKKSYVEPRDF